MTKKLKIRLTLGTLLIALFGITFAITYNHIVKSNMTAEQVINKMKESSLPIDNVRVYDENTDWNKLLGRPNQYTSKINFADTRLEQSTDPDNPNGGSIEVFNNSEDLETRKNYMENNAKKIPGLTEYHIVNGNRLLRLSRDLTSDQANEYKEVFMSIK